MTLINQTVEVLMIHKMRSIIYEPYSKMIDETSLFSIKLRSKVEREL